MIFIKFYIITEPKEHICPVCGAKTSNIHDYRGQTIKDLPFQLKHTCLVLRKRRYVCSCGESFMSLVTFYLCKELTKSIENAESFKMPEFEKCTDTYSGIDKNPTLNIDKELFLLI